VERGSDEVAGFLIIRAWIEAGPPRMLKIRIVTAEDPRAPAQVLGVTGDVEQACALIREWLGDFRGTFALP